MAENGRPQISDENKKMIRVTFNEDLRIPPRILAIQGYLHHPRVKISLNFVLKL